MRSLAAALVLVASTALAAPNQIGGGGGGGGTPAGTFDTIVNLSSGDTPQAGIQPTLSGDDTAPYVVFRGTVDLTFAGLTRSRVRTIAGVTSDGPYKAWLEATPSENFESGWPVADGTKITTPVRGRWHFDNVQVNYDCTGQNLPVALIHLGNVFLNGHATSSNAPYGGQFTLAPDLTGTIYVRLTGDCDGSINDEIAFRRDPTSLFSRTTATVAIWVDGWQYSNNSDLSIHIENSAATDHDDICFWADSSGSNSWAGPRCTGMARGLYFTGSVLSDFYAPNLIANDINVQYGDLDTDGLYGCDRVFYTSCVAGSDGGVTAGCSVRQDACDDIRIWGGTAESGNLEFVAHSLGNANNITGMHIEGFDSGLTNHSAIIAGAGVCSDASTGGRAKKFAATAADCPGGALVCDANPDGFDIRFHGGNIPGDSSTTWDGTIIGGCANQAATRITLAGSVADGTDAAGTAVAFGWASAELTNNNMPIVEVTTVQRTGNFLWPGYRQLRHGGSLSIRCRLNVAAGSFDPTGASNYMKCNPLGAADGTAGLAATDPSAWATIEWANVLRYQIQRVDCGASLVHAGSESLDFIPVVADVDYSDLRPITVTGNLSRLSGNPIAVKAHFEAAFTPHASLEIAPDSSLIGMKITGTGNEAHEECTITLVPLK